MTSTRSIQGVSSNTNRWITKACWYLFLHNIRVEVQNSSRSILKWFNFLKKTCSDTNWYSTPPNNLSILTIHLVWNRLSNVFQQSSKDSKLHYFYVETPTSKGLKITTCTLIGFNSNFTKSTRSLHEIHHVKVTISNSLTHTKCPN